MFLQRAHKIKQPQGAPSMLNTDLKNFFLNNSHFSHLSSLESFELKRMTITIYSPGEHLMWSGKFL